MSYRLSADTRSSGRPAMPTGIRRSHEGSSVISRYIVTLRNTVKRLFAAPVLFPGPDVSEGEFPLTLQGLSALMRAG